MTILYLTIYETCSITLARTHSFVLSASHAHAHARAMAMAAGLGRAARPRGASSVLVASACVGAAKSIRRRVRPNARPSPARTHRVRSVGRSFGRLEGGQGGIFLSHDSSRIGPVRLSFFRVTSVHPIPSHPIPQWGPRAFALFIVLVVATRIHGYVKGYNMCI